MRDVTCDILVVGAGPAGSSAARAAAWEGAHVLLAERRPVVGLPVRCAEYIPAMLVGQADVGQGYIVQNTTGMRSFLHGRCIQDMAAPGCLIDRHLFDQALADAAVRAGAQLLVGHSALTRAADGTVLLAGPGGTRLRVRATVIIGADGPQSRVAHWAGLGRSRCLPAVAGAFAPAGKAGAHPHLF